MGHRRWNTQEFQVHQVWQWHSKQFSSACQPLLKRWRTRMGFVTRTFRVQMQFRPSICYPNNEKPKLDKLENLFREWHLHFVNNSSRLEKHIADDMVFDGFYPYYSSQKKRILFIAWESVDIDGCNYIDLLYKSYRETKRIGSRHLDQSKFHYLMMYITYGILNGMPTWQEIPCASKIGDTFGDPNGLSFAFMNISKLSNEKWQANHAVIDTAYALSTYPRNFIQEEIAILEPHIVIAMSRTKKDKITSLGQLTAIDDLDQVESYWLDSGTHRSLLINTWHFSAWAKTGVECYYNPICDALRRSEMDLERIKHPEKFPLVARM